MARMVQTVGLAVGGRPGSRLLRQLGAAVERTTVLSRVKALPIPATPRVRVLGVDEFAIRRGRTYATLLCDVETRRPVDLLPERTADSLVAWLAAHPGVEIICRDRSSVYSEGAKRGAPSATQVADRWHLLQNLTAAVEKTAHAHRACLRKAAEPLAAPGADQEPDAPGGSPIEDGLPPSDPPGNQLLARTRQRHADVLELLDQGHTMAATARILGLDPRTVKRFATEDLENMLASARDRRPAKIDPFKPLLQARFHSGCHNANQLFREIAERGYPGSHQSVRRYVATLRSGTADLEERRVVPSPRQITGWIMRSPSSLSEDEQQRLKQVMESCPDLSIARELAGDFHAILRRRSGQADLADWSQQVLEHGSRPLQGFAAFLQNDWDAVVAGLSLPWNSGVVEGHVTRVKLIKRRCFGRASFGLLRTLVLAQPP
ncbi:ISL3 family transposase [Catenulispora subtropica]|uniref:ISL3 family transposase n=2 Tax=Catenulispora subtropica TaxID=450798 RepID=A0ABN2SX75_9ACTN